MRGKGPGPSSVYKRHPSIYIYLLCVQKTSVSSFYTRQGPRALFYLQEAPLFKHLPPLRTRASVSSIYTRQGPRAPQPPPRAPWGPSQTRPREARREQSLSVSPSVCPSVCLSVSVFMAVCLSLCPSVCLSVCLSPPLLVRMGGHALYDGLIFSPQPLHRLQLPQRLTPPPQHAQNHRAACADARGRKCGPRRRDGGRRRSGSTRGHGPARPLVVIVRS
jgi:hypothetical protein